MSTVAAQQDQPPEQQTPAQQPPAEQAEPEDQAAAAQPGAEADPGDAAAEPEAETGPDDTPAQPPEQSARQSDQPVEEESEVPVQSLTGPLRMLVHPVYPPERARLVFQPLVDYLDSVGGLDVELEVDRNFHRYWLDSRQNETPQLVLESAHIAAWRMQQFDYRPLVTAASPVTYSMLTSGDMAEADLEDFIGRRIASMPSPSLGYQVLARWYSNPLQQPLIESTATSWLDAVEMIFSGEAAAAIAPDNLAQRYPNLYPVRTSVEFPGLTLSAGPDLPEDVRERLIEAMTTLHDNPDHHAALFELDIDRFVAANPADYRGLEEWLGSIFRL